MKVYTERLILRKMTPEDREAIFRYRSDADTNRFQSWIPETSGEVEEFIKNHIKDFNVPGTWFQLLIAEKDSGSVIGDIGVHFIGSDGQQAELGITVSKEYHHKGYASEALKGIIGYLFQEFGKHRITASVDPRNTASMKLMERVGFRKEGHFIKSLFWKNEWADDVIFALLKDEWETGQ